MFLKIEIKGGMLSKYQILIADLYNLPIVNGKKLVLKFFDEEKHVLHCENLHFCPRLRLKQKNTLAIRNQSVRMDKTIY